MFSYMEIKSKVASKIKMIQKEHTEIYIGDVPSSRKSHFIR